MGPREKIASCGNAESLIPSWQGSQSHIGNAGALLGEAFFHWSKTKEWTMPSHRLSRARRASLAVAATGGLLLSSLGVMASASNTNDQDGSVLDGPVLATVSGLDRADAQDLLASDLDVVELAGDSAEVLVMSPEHRADLLSRGLTVELRSAAPDFAALDRSRAEEAGLAKAVAQDSSLASDLPTGRVSYRTVDEVQAEIQQIARDNPGRVKLVAMQEPSLLGRTIYGLEIAHDVNTESGDPVFLTTGIHHSREWPTAELTLEFVHDVLASDGTDPRVSGLLEDTRLIVVPMVNPDGYDVSRSLINEMKRKNCRVVPGAIPTWEECTDDSSVDSGVDVNRNYAAFWGGPGSSASLTASNHHGQSPYSEPEIRNMVDLTNRHQVMVAVNNHTPDARLLRAPASPLEPVPVEEAAYHGLALHIGGALGWPTGPWTEVYYVASGVAEQEALYATGTFGFTPELMPGFSGLERFHPPYEFLDDQYWGDDHYEGSSFREAILRAWEASADPALHSVITGTAPKRTELIISREVTVKSSPVDLGQGETVVQRERKIETRMTVPNDGQIEWHVLPSMRQSQDASELLEESWTVSCRNPAGKVHHFVEVSVARGQQVAIDMSDCPGGPKKGIGQGKH